MERLASQWRRAWIWAACGGGVAGLLRLVGLGRYPHLIYDEYYYVSAADVLIGQPPPPAFHQAALVPFIDPNLGSHPPLGKELIALAIHVGANQPFWWRLPSGVLGTLAVLPMFLLAQSLWSTPAAAAVAVWAVALDGLALSLAHVALLDGLVFPVCIASLWAMWRTSQYFRKGEPLPVLGMVGTGVLLGMGLAMKWSGAQTILIGLVWFAVTLSWYRRWTWRRLWQSFVIFAIVPLSVYAATYLYAWPRGFRQSWLPPGFWQGLVSLQGVMFHGMWKLKFGYPSSAPARTWLLLPRPIILLDWFHGGTQTQIVTLTDPLAVWLGVLGLVWIGWRSWHGRPQWRRPWAFLVLCFAIYYPLWMITPRTKFYYYFLPALVPLYLALSIALTDGWQDPARWRRWLTRGVAVALAVTTLYFIPMASGIPTPPQAYNRVLWLPQWNPVAVPSTAKHSP